MAGRQLDEALLASQAQRTALGGAERRADIAQEAGLFGEVAGQGMGFPRATMAGQEANLRRELARSADERAAQAQQAQLFGQVVGQGGPIQTLGGMQALEAIEGQRLAREATEAGLTGRFRGDETVQQAAQSSALRSEDLQRRLAEAGVTGDFRLGGSARPVQTLQAQALASEMEGQALQRALQRAGATGEFIEEGADADAAVPTLESRLRTAGLTGLLDGQQTLAGQQAEMDRIGAILAALDPAMEGRADPLAEALGATVGEAQEDRIMTQFLEEAADVNNFDDYFRLAEKYADQPRILEAIEQMMGEQRTEEGPLPAGAERTEDGVFSRQGNRLKWNPVSGSWERDN